MTHRIVAINTLLPGVQPADYEEWLRTVDVPAVRNLVTITKYEVVRLAGPVMDGDEVPFHYVEIVDVTDIDSYRDEIHQSADAVAVIEDFGRYVGSSVLAYGDVLDFD